MNVQMVRAGQGNLSLLSVQADQQYHGLQQYPEVLGYQPFPAGGNGEKEKEKVVYWILWFGAAGIDSNQHLNKVYMFSVKMWRIKLLI